MPTNSRERPETEVFRLTATGADAPRGGVRLEADERHQKALEAIRRANSSSREDEARVHLRKAAAFERELVGALTHPARAIVAETGALAAMRAGVLGQAREIAKSGLQGTPSSDDRWYLERLITMSTFLEVLAGRTDCVPDWASLSREGPFDLAVRTPSQEIRISVEDEGEEPTTQLGDKRISITIPLRIAESDLRSLLAPLVPDRSRREIIYERDLEDTPIFQLMSDRAA